MSRGTWEEYDHTDQDIFVYDQCCDNCCNSQCPMVLPWSAEDYREKYGTLEGFDEEEAREKEEEVMELRKNDAIMCGEEPKWCIYWQGSSGHGNSRRGGRG